MQVDGSAYHPRSPHDARDQGIRAVHQEFSLVPQLSVAENLLLGELPTLAPGIVDWATAHREAGESLAALDFEGIDTHLRVDHLGVSQRQMVEIAKALRGTPRVVILDEPSAVLSNKELERLFAVLRAFRRDGGTVVYVSHRLDEVLRISDRITVLKDGERVGTVETAAVGEQELIRMMVGRPLSEIYPARQRPPVSELLTLEGLSGPGFHDVDLALGTGEVVGLFGLVGAGRTELARAIFGATRLSSGGMSLDGRPYRPRSPADALRAGVAMLGEERGRDGLVMPASVLDNLTLASLGQLSRFGVIRRRQQRETASGQVEGLDIRPPVLGRTVRMLSGGNQQKVVFGKWLIRGARVQILDEPTRGVDVATKVQIYQIIADLADRGLAVLLISSDLPEIIGMSDRIIVMRHGQRGRRGAGRRGHRGAAADHRLRRRGDGRMSGPGSSTSSPGMRGSEDLPSGAASLGSHLRSRLGSRGWLDLALPVVFLVLLVFAAVSSDTFLTENNISNLLRQIVINGLLSLGMLVVILSGGIDLSVGAVVALSAILVGVLMESVPMPVAILLAISAAAVVGLVNGGIIARFKIAPFIMTLGTLSAVRGLVYVISETPVVYDDPDFLSIGSAEIGPVPVITLLMIAAFVLMSFFLNRTTPGRAIIAIGGNEEAVRLAGINVRLNTTLAYVICSTLAGIAGVVLASRVGISQPSVAAGYELDAIAACVIGGAILGGGGGSVRGTFAGVLVLGLISNLLNMYNVQAYYQQIFKGVLIVLAVLARRKER